MGTFDLHVLILCVSEGILFWLLFTMCTLNLLALMDRFHVSLKASFPSEFGSTMTTMELLTFMDRFHVSLKASFLSEFGSTMELGTFHLHGLISHESEGATSFLLHIHIVNMDDVSTP